MPKTFSKPIELNSFDGLKKFFKEYTNHKSIDDNSDYFSWRPYVDLNSETKNFVLIADKPDNNYTLYTEDDFKKDAWEQGSTHSYWKPETKFKQLFKTIKKKDGKLIVGTTGMIQDMLNLLNND